MTERPDARFLMQEIERSIAETAPFDISPRGIRFRPHAELSALIERLAALGDIAAAALADRIDHTGDPLMAIVWLHSLRQIGTTASSALFERILDRIQRRQRWADQFPGLREVLLFAGRS